MASCAFDTASAGVSPWAMQPGSPGTSTTKACRPGPKKCFGRQDKSLGGAGVRLEPTPGCHVSLAANVAQGCGV
jgi:hypothetical protein